MLITKKRPSRIMSFFSKLIFGVVLAPVATVYSRFFLSSIVASIIAIVQRTTGLDRRVRALLEVAVSVENGCEFCADFHAYDHKSIVSGEELARLVDDDLNRFSGKEKCVIQSARMWVKGRSSPVLEEQLSSYFSEKEIIRLVWLTAAVSFFNLQGRVLMLRSHRLSKIKFENVQRS